MRLVDLKTQALRYLALGEPEKALLVYRGILLQVPSDLDSRMRVADVLAQIGQQHLACRVYAAVAWCDLQAGRPLHALVCSQALADLGQSVESLHESLAELYGAGSLRLRTPLLIADLEDDEPESPEEVFGGGEGGESSQTPQQVPSEVLAALGALESGGAGHHGDPHPPARRAFGDGDGDGDLEEVDEVDEVPDDEDEPDDADDDVLTPPRPSTGPLRSWSAALELARGRGEPGDSADPHLPRDGGFAYANHLLHPSRRATEDAPVSVLPDPQHRVSEAGLLNLPLDQAAEAAAAVAADVRSFPSFPPEFWPIPLLSALRGEAFVRLSQAARIRRVGPREVLQKEGAQGGGVLLIASGAVQLYRERDGQRRLYGALGEGAVIGDQVLIGARPAPLTIETTEPTDLIELPLRALRTLASEDPAAARALQRYTGERLLGALLLSGPLFRPLPLRQRRVLLSRFQLFRAAPEQVLLREGERMEGMCVVLAGGLEALRGQEPFEEILGHLPPGFCMGEAALLRPMVAPFTLRAESAATVLFLSRESFEGALRGAPEARAFLYGVPSTFLRELSGTAGVGRDTLPRAGAPLVLTPEGDDPTDSADWLIPR